MGKDGICETVADSDFARKLMVLKSPVTVAAIPVAWEIKLMESATILGSVAVTVVGWNDLVRSPREIETDVEQGIRNIHIVMDGEIQIRSSNQSIKNRSVIHHYRLMNIPWLEWYVVVIPVQ